MSLETWEMLSYVVTMIGLPLAARRQPLEQRIVLDGRGDRKRAWL